MAYLPILGHKILNQLPPRYTITHYMTNVDELLTDLTQVPIIDFASNSTSIFGPYREKRLPFPTAVPLYSHFTETIERPTNSTLQLLGLLKKRSEYLYRQAIDVAAHSFNFGAKLGLGIYELNTAYTIGLLQGIGKCLFPKLVELPRSLTNEENMQLRKHTILSFLILRKFQYHPIITYAGLYHHVSYSKALGYPNPDEDIQHEVKTVAAEFGLEKYVPIVILPQGLSHADWQLYSIVNLLTALTSAIDQTRPYRKPVKLKDIPKDFESYWSEWYNPDLRETFLAYVGWLEEQSIADSSINIQ